MPCNRPRALLASESAPAARHEVEDQDDHGEHQEKVNQTASYVKAEAHEPQNQNDYKYCPEHLHPFLALLAPETWNLSGAPTMHS